MNKGNLLFRVFALLFVIAVLSPLPAMAEIEEGTGHVDLYLGMYFPKGDDLDDELTYGIRGGYDFTERIGAELTIGRVEFSDSMYGYDWSIDGTFIDASLIGYFNPESKFVGYGFVGLGYVHASGDVEGYGSVGSDNDTSLNGGFGGKFFFSDVVYARPEVRMRYYIDPSEAEFEATIGVGFTFGK